MGLFHLNFSLGRGVRAGNPLSAYLYIINLEMISATIGTSEDVEGIPVSGKCNMLISD